MLDSYYLSMTINRQLIEMIINLFSFLRVYVQDFFWCAFISALDIRDCNVTLSLGHMFMIGSNSGPNSVKTKTLKVLPHAAMSDARQ